MEQSSQQRVADFIEKNQLECEIPIRLFDLLSELGEVAKEYLIHTNYGNNNFTLDINWKMEVGDLYFSLLALAVSSGIELEEALEIALQKYNHRLAIKGRMDSST